MPVQDRANIVCTECHSRKIKCDLQTSSGGVCKNCRRSNRPCIKRSGVRKRQAVARPQERDFQGSQAQSSFALESLFQDTTGPFGAVTEQGSGDSDSRSLAQRGHAFVSHCSTSYYEESTETAVPESPVLDSSYMRGAVLKSTQAADLPRPALARAWMDAYMTHAFHYCPVTEKKDLSDSGSSVLLQLSICLVGNLMRHDSSGPKLAQELYEKVKVLIAVNYEQDCVQTLKALCLMSCWNGKPSNPIGLDEPWHWIGVAARLMLQMGLHREYTYAKLPDAGCLRRIFWQIHNSETLQVACWGHPRLLRRKDFDVKLPTLEDFETSKIQPLVFLESTKLCTIISTISEHHLERRPIRPEELANIEAALCDWMGHLPEELRLYDVNGHRKTYCRPTSEIFIQYFVTIILIEFLRHRDGKRPLRVSIPSLIAASCAVALYDEIYCRDETIFLPSINGFFCLAAALPLIHHIPQSVPKEASRRRELDILRSIITGMRDRYGDSDMALRKMNNLERSIQSATVENGGPNTTLSGTQEPCAYAKELFPFPPTICDNMDLLQLAAEPVSQFIVDNFAPVQNWPADETGFDFTLIDLFGLDFGDSSVVVENGGNELDIDEQIFT